MTVLVGANGQGKTNLVEAVGYLATLVVAPGRPPTRRWSGGGAAAAVVRATAVNDGRERTVQVEINPGKANRARVNRSPVPRPREMLGIVRTVCSPPRTSPSSRATRLSAGASSTTCSSPGRRAGPACAATTTRCCGSARPC